MGLTQDLSDGTVDHWINGDSNGHSSGTQWNTTNSSNSSNFVLGNRVETLNDRSCASHVGEFLLIKHDPSSVTSLRTKIEGYLANKWGSTLPSGHTYETEPPRLTSGFTG